MHVKLNDKEEQQTRASASTAIPDKVRKPTIAGGGNTEDCQYFDTRWREYTAATKIVGTDKVLQLLECCGEELRRDLTRQEGGSLSEKTGKEVLTAIRKLAVREENTMVARFALNQMVQGVDEPVRNFGARTKARRTYVTTISSVMTVKQGSPINGRSTKGCTGPRIH